MTALPATSDDSGLWGLWLTPYHLPCITAADEVGTFAAISCEALTTDELAKRLDAEPRALGTHLGLLAAIGMVERRDGKCCAALPSGDRIMLHEILMNDVGTGPLVAAAFSMLMLLGTTGRQNSLPEFTAILESAGFVNVQAERTGGGYYSLVSANKP